MLPLGTEVEVVDLRQSDLDDASAGAGVLVGAVQRVLESVTFAKAEQSRRFLAYVARETLAGRGDQLNERSIARLALDRTLQVDVREDPSVRVLAGRVRKRLGHYYRGEGQGDVMRISMPIGQYALICSAHRPVAITSERASDGPLIAITRFLSGGRGSASHALAAGLSESLVHALTRFPGVRVAGPLTASGMSEATDAIDIGVRTTARFVLFGRVRESNHCLRVNVHVAETSHGQVVWSEQFEVDAATYGGFDAEDEIVARLAAEVADHRGVALRSPAPPGRLSDEPAGYRAISGYYQFVDSLDPAEGAVVVAELERAVAAEPSNAFLVGLLASAHSIAVLMRGAVGASESFALAANLGQRTLALDPTSPYAHSALATVALARGDRSGCRTHVDAVIEFAPHHPSFLYRAGLLSAGCGQWDEGIALIKRATRLNPHHPSHFRTMIVLDHLRRDDFAAALAEAELIRFDGYVWAPLCSAICLNELGMTREAAEEVAVLVRTVPDFFERPREIISAAPAIPPDVIDLLVRHVADLAVLATRQ